MKESEAMHARAILSQMEVRSHTLHAQKGPEGLLPESEQERRQRWTSAQLKTLARMLLSQCVCARTT